MGGPRAGEGAAFGQPWAAFGQPCAAFPGLTQVVGAGGGKKEEETERAWFLSTGSSGLAQGTRQEPLGTWASLKSSPCQPGFYFWWERKPISHLRESWAANQETREVFCPQCCYWLID